MVGTAEVGDGAPARLPSGVVTFVMTDIEGSTRLFHRFGEAYVDLQAQHHALLRDAFSRHGGVEVKTEGDALFVAYWDAADAVAACLDAQRGLLAHPWPPQGELRVRMGLHTGEARPVGRDYVALAVHQVARICAGAHGGQVLLSEATATAVGMRLPPGAGVVPLGSFQLRGFPTPERLFQLRHPALPDDFPPLRALGVVAHNLPYFRTSFVGRTAERATLAGLLARTGVVTVVGPAGVGKTRLAVQVAFDVMEDHGDGAWLVELGTLTDPAMVAHAVAAAVGVAESPGLGIEDLVVDALARKDCVLLLDNCEHLLDAVAGLAERLTRHGPELAVLATSREPLDVEGEVVFRLDPLPIVDPALPVELPALVASDAARLFAERAALARPGFRLDDTTAADVARILAHLDGIPLAIELAAATLVDRSLPAVCQGLGDRFALLSRRRRSAPGRHQTLRAALEWSLQLLTADERRVFARLAAFAGGGSTAAAVDVCGGDPASPAEVAEALRRLVRSSLLVAHPELADRWSMLESVRQLAAIELATTGEDDRVAARHRSWFADWVEQVAGRIGLRGAGDVVRDLGLDHDNVRRALDTAAAAGDVTTGLRLAAAMSPFWTSQGHWTEGCERLRAVLAPPGGDDRWRGRALVATGSLLLLRGDLDEAASDLAAGTALAAAAGDEVTEARGLSGMGYVAFRASRLDEADRRWTEALGRAERAGDERVVAGILRSLAVAAGSRGDQARTRELLDRALGLARRVGDDQLLRLLLGSAAEMELWLGDYRKADEQYADALDLADSVGDLSARPPLLAELGWVALLRGEVAVAARLAVEAAELAEDLGNRRVLAHALRLGGEAAKRRGSPAQAADAFHRALAVAQQLGAPAEVAGVRCSQASLALDDLDLAEAARLAEETIALSGLPHPMRLTTPELVLAAVALLSGDLEAAEARFTAGARISERISASRLTALARWGLARVHAAAGRRPEALRLHVRSLEGRARIGDRLGVAESLVGLADALAGVEPLGSARLVGAADAIRTASGATGTAREEADVAAAMAAASDAADAATVEAARDAGAAIDQDAALAEASRLVELAAGRSQR